MRRLQNWSLQSTFCEGYAPKILYVRMLRDINPSAIAKNGNTGAGCGDALGEESTPTLSSFSTNDDVRTSLTAADTVIALEIHVFFGRILEFVLKRNDPWS